MSKKNQNVSDRLPPGAFRFLPSFSFLSRGNSAMCLFLVDDAPLLLLSLLVPWPVTEYVATLSPPCRVRWPSSRSVMSNQDSCTPSLLGRWPVVSSKCGMQDRLASTESQSPSPATAQRLDTAAQASCKGLDHQVIQRKRRIGQILQPFREPSHPSSRSHWQAKARRRRVL